MLSGCKRDQDVLGKIEESFSYWEIFNTEAKISRGFEALEFACRYLNLTKIQLRYSSAFPSLFVASKSRNSENNQMIQEQNLKLR